VHVYDYAPGFSEVSVAVKNKISIILTAVETKTSAYILRYAICSIF